MKIYGDEYGLREREEWRMIPMMFLVRKTRQIMGLFSKRGRLRKKYLGEEAYEPNNSVLDKIKLRW